jgi:hypothetical protein
MCAIWKLIRSRDFAAANDAAGLGVTPEVYAWHRNQDSGLMQLIERQVPAKMGYAGGFSG